VQADLFYKVWDAAANNWYKDCWVKASISNPSFGLNTCSIAPSGNGCPAELKVNSGSTGRGPVDSGCQLYVYLDKAKGQASSIGEFDFAPAAAPAADEASAVASGVASPAVDASAAAAETAVDAAKDVAQAASAATGARAGVAAVVFAAALLM
jgi:hypothetical protein